jgi:hypothetical protein
MGRRDYRRHEAKKPKKNVKKTNITDILPPPVTVEVVKKKKKREPEEEF